MLASRLQSGEPPATFQAHAGAELSDYVAAGQIYSVPANIHRANIVWANPNVLSKAKITATPSSLDAWIADMKKLRAGGMDKPLAVATDWTQVHLLETVLIADLGPGATSGCGTAGPTGPRAR